MGADGGGPDSLTASLGNIVPREFVLTNREALAFGYGIAVGGVHEARPEFAAREWGW